MQEDWEKEPLTVDLPELCKHVPQTEKERELNTWSEGRK